MNPEIDGLCFRGDLGRTFPDHVIKGRVSGGANPSQSTQLFINSYVPFCDDVDTGYDKVSWEQWCTRTGVNPHSLMALIGAI